MNATKADRTVALADFGPMSSRTASLIEAQQWCIHLTKSHGENFSVLSRFVASSLVDDFSAVYAFCRAADDLGDETESCERSTELLAWWRGQLHQCFAGHASHPVFVALIPVIARHSLVQQPFDDLISAFEMDQTKARYETWDEVIGYCKLSAAPVGRLVLMLLGERRDDECLRASDAICTALQMTNHWQDARRDLLERNRIYVPREYWKVDQFEEKLVSTCRQGYAPDQMFMKSWRESLRELTVRTWGLF
ncbi:MAG: squalene/phytoene synthase family protein [Planctomycetota bacterium]|nr:squalene/phytoene synthase family protein [Planctomycetota bacterium]